MRITGVGNVRPSDDGKNVEITLHGISTIKLNLSAELAEVLVSQAIRALATCRANRSMPSNESRPDRKTILVEGFAVNLYPNHAMDLIIESDAQEHFQVSLTNLQGASLRGILLEGDGKRPPIENPDLPIH